MKKCVRRIIPVLALTAALLCFLPVNTYAGDINSAESRILSVARGTFSYNGKYYKAQDSYIAQLEAHLSEDDVDWDDSKVDGYISSIYASVGDGVAQGYLYEIDPATGQPITTKPVTPTTEVPTSEVPTSEVPSSEEKTTEEKKSTEAGKDDADVKEDAEESTADAEAAAEESKSAEEASSVAAAAAREEKIAQIKEKQAALNDKLKTGVDAIQDNGTTAIWDAVVEEKDSAISYQILSKRPAKESAKSIVAYDEDTKEIVITDSEGNVTKSVSGTVDGMSLISTLKTVFLIIACVILVLLIGSGITLYQNECFRFGKKNKKVDHVKKKKVRKTSGIIITASLSVCILGIFTTTGAYISIFSTSAVTNNLTSSGYYQYNYMQTQTNVENILYSHELDSDVLGELMDYDKFLFQGKQYVLDTLSGKPDSTSVKKLKEDITLRLTGINPDNEGFEEAVAAEIVEAYQNGIQNGVLHYFYNCKDAVKKMILVVFPLLILDLLLGLFYLLTMEHEVKSAIPKICIAAGAATVLLFVLAIITAIVKPYEAWFISPEYLYLFIVQFAQWSVTVFRNIGIAGAVIVLLLFLVYRYDARTKE